MVSGVSGLSGDRPELSGTGWDPGTLGWWVVWKGTGSPKFHGLSLSMIWGVSINGRSPIAGWFLLGTIPLRWMMTGGTPILGNHHLIITKNDLSISSNPFDVLGFS